MAAPTILAIDGTTSLGWAFGPAGMPPLSGTHLCGKKGASRGAVFNGAGRWITDFIRENKPEIVCCEAPAAGSNVQGRTTTRTAEITQGIPAVLEFMSWQFGIYGFKRIAVSSIRAHFIGAGNLKGEIAKPRVMEKCRALGWIKPDDEDQTFDRSDALALWSYAEAVYAPKLSQPVDDLFVKAQARGRA